MVKHIAGLILFSLIVGTSVFVAAVVSGPTVNVVESPSKYRLLKKKKKRKKRKRRCRPHKKKVNVSLDQAVFSRRTGLFTPSLTEAVIPYRYGNLELHFFAKDQFGTRFLRTETMPVSRSRYGAHLKEMPWLKRIDAGQNIYVIAQANKFSRGLTFPPDFSASVATPVLITDK